MDERLVLRDERGRRVLQQHHAAVEAGVLGKERRQSGEPPVDQQRGAAFADRAELGDGQRGEVERERDRLTVEVAARDHPTATGGDRVGIGVRAIGKDQRVVGAAVDLDLEDASRVAQRVCAPRRGPAGCSGSSTGPGPCALRRGASAAARSRAEGGAARQRRAAVQGVVSPRDTRRRTRRPSPAGPPRSSHRRLTRSRQGPPRRGRVSAPIAVICCVPFSRASPSLASRRSGPRPTRGQSVCAGHDRSADLRLAAPDQRPAEVREWSEVAGGSDGALLRDDRVHAKAQEVDAAAPRSLAGSRSGRARACWPAASSIARTVSWSCDGPTPTAWLTTRFSCSRRASAGSMRTFARSPKPVVTP